MTPEELEKLKQLCNEATPGPWESESYGGAIGDVAAIFTIATGDDGDVKNAMTVETASFIAASRTAVPALIAEVERLRGLVGEVNGGTEDACRWCGDPARYGHSALCPAFTPDGKVK